MTDRALAYRVYAHFGIPRTDWPAHYSVDCTRKNLSRRARAHYLAILKSLGGSDGLQ